MAQRKANEVESWLARPDPGTRIVLIYGPDRGLVSERAGRFAAGTRLPLDDPFTVVRVDAADVERQPGRLLDEVRTVPMFAERRLVWLRGAGSQKAVAAEVAALCADPPADALVLVEAGELKKAAALRTTVERSEHGMALPCYADEGKAIDALIDEAVERAGLSIGMEARQLLRAGLGGDRLASRGELEKLVLYCAGRDTVTPEDVRALGGDVSGLNADRAVDAVLSGRLADFDPIYARLLAAGNPPFLLLASALRQVHALQIMRRAMDADGKTVQAAVASARPPVFFARRNAVETALARWSAATLHAAAARLNAAILRTRQRPEIAAASARQALIALAIEAARARK